MQTFCCDNDGVNDVKKSKHTNFYLHRTPIKFSVNAPTPIKFFISNITQMYHASFLCREYIFVSRVFQDVELSDTFVSSSLERENRFLPPLFF